jgi:hypothetical protein
VIEHGLPGPISFLAVSSLFGVAHFYQGLTGIIDTGLTGLIIALHQRRSAFLSLPPVPVWRIIRA